MTFVDGDREVRILHHTRGAWSVTEDYVRVFQRKIDSWELETSLLW
jgi:hypothetical protein